MTNTIKIAVPTHEGQLSDHFGQASHFRIYEIEGNQIASSREEQSPPHEPGVIPKWMNDQGVGTLIAGCIGANAIAQFHQHGVQVVSGAPSIPTDELIREFVAATLVTTGHVCGCNHH